MPEGFVESLFFVSLMVVVGGALAMLLSVHVLVLARRLTSGTLPHILLNVIGWTVVLVGALGLAIPAFFVLGIVIWGIGLVLCAVAAARNRACRRNMTLWSLAAAADREIPLHTAAEALADDPLTSFGGNTRALSDLLAGGTPLSEALEVSGQLDTDTAESLVLVGEQVGAVAPALKDAATSRSAQQPLWQSLVGKFAYLFIVINFIWAAVTFMMWKIVPAFQKIFDDFGAELPATTKLLIAFSHFVVNYGALLLSPVFLLAACIFIYVILRYIGWIRFDVPGLSRFSLPLHRSTVLRCLALAAETDKPLQPAMATLADRHPSSSVRHHMRTALDGVRKGEPWPSAMQRSGLLRPADAGVLAAAERARNLSWALREVADGSLRRYIYRAQAAVEVLGALALILFGIIGFFIAMGMLMPMIRLCQTLT